MKVGSLAVLFSLLLVQSAGATFLRIDRQAATPNLLVFDIFWQVPGSQGLLDDNAFLDAGGNLLWKAGVRDRFPDSIRLIDLKVEMWGPDFQYSSDSWSFYVDAQRRFEQLASAWRWDEQHQRAERTPTDAQTPNAWWDTATFTLVDPYSARVAYTVPEPSILTILALCAVGCLIRRKFSS